MFKRKYNFLKISRPENSEDDGYLKPQPEKKRADDEGSYVEMDRPKENVAQTDSSNISEKRTKDDP